MITVLIVAAWVGSCACFYMAGRASAHIWPVKPQPQWSWKTEER